MSIRYGRNRLFPIQSLDCFISVIKTNPNQTPPINTPANTICLVKKRKKVANAAITYTHTANKSSDERDEIYAAKARTQQILTQIRSTLSVGSRSHCKNLVLIAASINFYTVYIQASATCDESNWWDNERSATSAESNGKVITPIERLGSIITRSNFADERWLRRCSRGGELYLSSG